MVGQTGNRYLSKKRTNGLIKSIKQTDFYDEDSVFELSRELELISHELMAKCISDDEL